uniref:Uncharacterized protein n=1 Tax=Arundo donax TaxID=35708 RepID=A0A0A9LUR2_ARUDO
MKSLIKKTKKTCKN